MVSPCKLQILNQIGVRYFSTSLIRIGGFVKKRPEDFVVNEVLEDGTDLGALPQLKGKGNEGGLFTWAILEKKGVDTFTAINIISKKLGISSKDVQFAGLKDSQGVTRQVVSFWNVDPERIKHIHITPFIKLKTPIKKPYPIRNDMLRENNFSIRITSCNLLENELRQATTSILKELKNNGIFNYYDLQRFGNTRPISHLVGIMLLKNDYTKAAWLYLTTTSDLENEMLQHLRKLLKEEKIDLNEFRTKIPLKYTIERTLSVGLLKGMKNPWALIDRRITHLFLAAAQSYFFNHLLSTLIETHNTSLERMKKILPEYLPVLGKGTNLKKYPTIITDIYADLVKTHDLEIENLTKKSKDSRTRMMNIYHHERKWNVGLSRLQATMEDDNTVRLDFNLPRGSYGTIVAREFTKNP